MKKLRYLLSMILLVLSMLVGCSTVAGQSSDTGQQHGLQEIESDTDMSDTWGEDSEETADSDKIGTSDTDEQSYDRNLSGSKSKVSVKRDGEYTSKEEVAAYLHQYGELPDNFITKKQAKKLGWVSSEGNLHEVAPGKSIGGDYFGNYEGTLPEKKGREYHECDIDSGGSYRGAKRIIYSNDGLIYYTEDHYESFELLYGEE